MNSSTPFVTGMKYYTPDYVCVDAVINNKQPWEYIPHDIEKTQALCFKAIQNDDIHIVVQKDDIHIVEPNLTECGWYLVVVFTLLIVIVLIFGLISV